MILLRRIFSENDEKNDKIKTAGALATLGGGTFGFANNIGAYSMINKISDNAAKKYGVTKLKPGVLFGVGAHDASKKADRALRMNKSFRRFNRLGKVGTGVAIAGAGVLGGKTLYDNFNKNKKK